MRPLRRNEYDARVEIMPLIDVIFLLLTFFLYVMVLMRPVRVIPMEMHALVGGAESSPAPVVTISIDRRGSVFVNEIAVPLGDVRRQVEEVIAGKPSSIVYLGVSSEGDRDRLPEFLTLYEELALAGLDVRLFSFPEGTP